MFKLKDCTITSFSTKSESKGFSSISIKTKEGQILQIVVDREFDADDYEYVLRVLNDKADPATWSEVIRDFKNYFKGCNLYASS